LALSHAVAVRAIGAVLLTYWCALAFVSCRGALLAALMMASCTMLGVEARLAKTDAVLLFTIVAVMSAVARVYLASRGWPTCDAEFQAKRPGSRQRIYSQRCWAPIGSLRGWFVGPTLGTPVARSLSNCP
jgi:4-amino-4-deoxy-L-arabinose transferase-like glycosyltransferase